MDEFIREVDEEYRRERLAKLWARYSGLVIALALVLVGGVGGWRYWQHRESEQAQAAALRYEDALQLSRDGKSDEAEKGLSDLAADGPAGYRLLARLRLAAELGRGADPEAGAKAFDAIAADGTVAGWFRDLARFRAASLRVGAGEAGAPERELEQLATPTGTWRHSAREILGLAALKRGDFDVAGRWFDQIATDRETPPNLRGRLEIYTALVAGGPAQTSTQ